MQGKEDWDQGKDESPGRGLHATPVLTPCRAIWCGWMGQSKRRKAGREREGREEWKKDVREGERTRVQ
jgi:hypothetical protein